MSRHMFSQCVYGFARQWPYLSYLGIGAWWAWVWVCYSSTTLIDPFHAAQGSVITMMYAASTLSIAVLLLLAGVFWKRFTPLVSNNAVVVASGAVAGVATAVLGTSAFAGNTPAFLAASVVTGLGTGVLCLKCGQVYGRLAVRDSLMMGFMSLVFACFLYFVVVGLVPLGGVVALVAAALLPLGAALLFIMPGDDPFPEAEWVSREREHNARSAKGRRSFSHLVVASALVAVTADVGQGLATMTLSAEELSQVGVVSTIVIGVLALAFAVFVCGGDVVGAVRRLYSFLMLWGVAVLLLSCFGLNLAYMGIGKEELWMLFSCLMAYMVFRFDFSPIRAFGIGQSVYFFASLASWLLGAWMAQVQDQVPYLSMLVAVVFAFVIVLVMAFVFNDSDIKFILTWHPEEKGVGGTTAPSSPLSTSTVHSFDEAEGAGAVKADAASQQQAGEGPDAGDAQGEGQGEAQRPGSPSSDGGQEAAAPVAAPTLHELVASIPEGYGVSEREAEVLELFAQGRSANWIADDLSISKNTVRSHVRSFYTKLDVHTRQELLDFLSSLSK